MKILYILIIAIISILSYDVCYGESPVSADLNLYGTYIDNIYQASFPESDYISLTQLDLSYDFDSGMSIFYDVRLSLFSKHSELHNHDHSLGIGHEKEIFQGKGTLFYGSGLELRQNTIEYDFYNYYNGSVYTDLKYHFSETFTSKAGFSIDYEHYPNYQPFSFFENSGFLQFSKSFQTKTSLHLGLNAGLRKYPNLDDQKGIDYSTKLTSTVKVGQSLTEKTGLQLLYSWNYLPQSIEYNEILEKGYFFIEDILEDEYSFSSHKYQITLKHIGLWNTMLKGTLSRENRTYNVPIDTKNEKRTDNNSTFYLEIEKKLSPPIDSFKDLSLNIGFLYRKSKSNDPDFDYYTNITSLGIKAAF